MEALGIGGGPIPSEEEGWDDGSGTEDIPMVLREARGRTFAAAATQCRDHLKSVHDENTGSNARYLIKGVIRR